MDFVGAIFDAVRCEDHVRGRDALAALLDVTRNPAVNVTCWQTPARGTPLHVAATHGRPDLLRLLLAHPSVDVGSQLHPHGGTALMVACERREGPSMMLLLADPRVAADVTDGKGRTALWYAARHGALECIKLLMLSGKPLNVAAAGLHWDDKLYTALGISDAMKTHEVSGWLRRYQADHASVVHILRLEYRVPENTAANLFGVAVLVSDGYLRCMAPEHILARRGRRPDIFAERDCAEQLRAVRFFNAGSRLPLELQMMIGFRGAGSPREIIPTWLVEQVFRTFTYVSLIDENEANS